MTKEIWIYLCGIYSLGFAVFHVFFWKLFRWKDDLQKLSRPNRGIVQILNLRIIYYFIFVGTICFVFPEELGETQLGKFFLAGNALFWAGRTVEQFVFLRINHRIVHVLSLLFILGIFLFATPAFGK